MSSKLRVGIAGPVGSGKTALVETLCLRLKNKYQIAVVTNDIYTKEDANFLIKKKVLDKGRIIGVETGGCPHTAIREDCSLNKNAVIDLENKFDLAEMVSANLNIMKNDTNFMRKGKPWFFTNLCSGKGVDEVLKFLEAQIPKI